MAFAGQSSRGASPLKVDSGPKGGDGHDRDTRSARPRSATRGTLPALAGRHVSSARPSKLGLGIAMALSAGVVIGVGAALLTAPRSGKEVRQVLSRRRRRLQNRAWDAWDELSYELRRARRKLLRKRRAAFDDMD